MQQHEVEQKKQLQTPLSLQRCHSKGRVQSSAQDNPASSHQEMFPKPAGLI